MIVFQTIITLAWGLVLICASFHISFIPLQIVHFQLYLMINCSDAWWIKLLSTLWPFFCSLFWQYISLLFIGMLIVISVRGFLTNLMKVTLLMFLLSLVYLFALVNNNHCLTFFRHTFIMWCSVHCCELWKKKCFAFLYISLGCNLLENLA